MKKIIIALSAILIFLCSCSDPGVINEEKIEKFKKEHENEIINFDDYFEVAYCEVGAENPQEKIDKNYLVKYIDDYFHHNTTEFLTVVFSIDEGDTFILDNKKWVMGKYVLGNVVGYDDFDESAYFELNAFNGGFNDENGNSFIDLYVNSYIVTCNFDVKGYDRYFFPIYEVIEKKQFKDGIVDFDGYYENYQNTVEGALAFIGANRNTFRIIELLNENDPFYFENRKYRFKKYTEIEFRETEDKPGYGYYYDEQDNVYSLNGLSNFIFVYYRGADNNKYGVLEFSDDIEQ